MDSRKRSPSGPCALTLELRASSVGLGRHLPIAGKCASRESQPGHPGGQEVNFGSFAAEKHGGDELPQARGAVGVVAPKEHSWSSAVLSMQRQSSATSARGSRPCSTRCRSKVRAILTPKLCPSRISPAAHLYENPLLGWRQPVQASSIRLG
ncbi:unnamed protein product [Symbiodinium sp. CCMP2456]|nr:unnamed protein product [Symbiodinium sp. CCMP2456]